MNIDSNATHGKILNELSTARVGIQPSVQEPRLPRINNGNNSKTN